MKGKWRLSGILLCSGVVLFAALGMLTSHLLRMEKENARAEVQRAYEDELRLAMWQLDSAGMRLLLSGGEDVTRETFSIQKKDKPVVEDGVSKELSQVLNGRYGNANVIELTKQAELKSKDSIVWSSVKGEFKKELEKSNRDALQQIEDRKRTNKVGYANDAVYREETGRVQRQARVEVLDQNVQYNFSKQEVTANEEKAELYRPTWVEGDLYLTRANDDGSIEGRWMNVEKLKAALLASVIPTLHGASLISVDQVNNADPLAMVTWPLRLEAAPVRVPQIQGMTPVRTALTLGWVAALAAIAAVLGLLFGLWKLSERRAAFVSAVTHELRTPLTKPCVLRLVA